MARFLDNLKNFLDTPEALWKHLFFFRDPNRVIVPNDNILYSPADGTVLYTARTDVNQRFLNVKGVPNLNVLDIVKKPITGEVVIVGVFMSFWDVHVNRLPSNGNNYYERIIGDKLLSMLPVEMALMKNDNPLESDLSYILINERMVNIVTSALNGKEYIYYLVQIADSEVDCIVPFHDQYHKYNQGDRFGMIRWGSQVDLIIPTDQSIDIDILVNVGQHVKAGLDPILSIK